MWKIELKEIDKIVVDRSKAYTVVCGQSQLIREAWFTLPDGRNYHYKQNP